MKIMRSNKQISTIEEYIASFPKDTQVLLEKIRQVIRSSAPNSIETISYQIPTFKQNGNLVHFAAYKNHIGFYPTSSGINKFKKKNYLNTS